LFNHANMQRTKRSRNWQRKPSKQANAVTVREWPPRAALTKEVYAFDIGTTLTTSGTWQIQNGYCAIPSSAGSVDRQGLRITPLQMEFDVYVKGVQLGGFGALAADHFVRVVIFQARYAAPINTDVFTTGNNMTSPYNMSHVGQSKDDANIKILWDEYVPVWIQSQCSHLRRVRIPTSDLLVKHFRFADFTATDPLNGGIYVAFITDQTIAGKYATIIVQSRLMYTDA